MSVGPVFSELDFGDLRRTSPIAPRFGLDRGTPIDRYYIEQFLDANAGAIAGRVLEVADDSYTRRFGQERVTRADVVDALPSNPRATIIADLTDAPQIADDTFDCVICTQVLQYLYDARAAVSTLHRIVRPSGIVLATLPGISQSDDLPTDGVRFWNFTARSASRLFAEAFGADSVQTTASGNVLVASAFLHGLVLEDLKPDELVYTDPMFPFLITVRAEKR
jgi:SAM-dependent methyltransferase